MKKILVTTDFSDHSKSGLRFAIQLAAQNDYHLTFINIHHLQTPSAWDTVRLDEYQDEQKQLIHAKLIHFVEKIYATLHKEPQHIQYAVEISALPDDSIKEYAEENEYDYICMSTRGTGALKKILGSVTSNLISLSKVPLIIVPHDYKVNEVRSVLYASDLDDYEKEVIKVLSFAKPIGASIELLNFTTEPFDEENREILKNRIEKITQYPVSVHVEERDGDDDLLKAIESVVKKTQPSVLVMFTEQNKNWFEKIFYAGHSAEYSFHTKVPLLIFRKQVEEI